MKKVLVVIFGVIAIAVKAQQIDPLLTTTGDQFAQLAWVDSIYDSMSLQEKVGQLFMVDVFSQDPKSKTDKVKTLIRDYHLGGVIFSKGGPLRQAKLNNQLQATAKLPLLVGMDAEWGLAMRLDSTYAFPWNMTLGAITDNGMVEKAGYRIGEHSKRLGVHINFAPVVDINTNPKNPIIGNRSFGESRENVTDKASAFFRGMQNAGVLANAKHFPGHGDTDADSHKTLPTIGFTKQRLDSLELYPYKRLIAEGLSSVMVAHLNVPALEEKDGFPSSLSENIVTELLKGEMGFNGLIFTDALNMKGASNFKEPGDIDLAAFMAGNDVLLISEDVPKAHSKLVSAYRDGRISEERLALSVKKILKAKYWAGLHNYKPVDTQNLFADLNTPEDDALNELLLERALTVVKNDSATLPIKDLKDKRYAYVSFGDASGTAFYNQLNKYTKVDWVKASSLERMISRLKKYDQVIIGFHKSNENPWKSYKIKDNELVWLYEIARTNKVSLNIFTSPYALLDLDSLTNFESVAVAYQNSVQAQEIAAQMLFGARVANGKLPVGVGAQYPAGSGIDTEVLKRLQYGTARSVGLNPKKLKKIDTLARNGVWAGMMPGAQIVVARKGKIVYQKTFGYHTPKKERRVKATDLYDVASLTKILATLPMVMQLYDRGVINMDTELSEMLPDYSRSNKATVTLKRMLSHNARLRAWIPFYIKTLDTVIDGPSEIYYSKVANDTFPLKVAQELYMREDFKDSIFEQIKESELRSRRGYKYSDLPFYILKKYLEEFHGNSLDRLVQRDIYEPLGANYTTYNPLEKFEAKRIPPTEEDYYFRMQKVQGYVHDQGAAMLGGVSGHAGVFSNANDVAKIMQMYLWKGYYGGERYFQPATLDAFNTCYFCEDDIRRGVGFDKPQLGDVGPTCGCVSMLSFGHSGFTGTFTWADPEEEVLYVFLSNRTYPTADNRMIISSGLRSRIQQVIYDAIIRD